MKKPQISEVVICYSKGVVDVFKMNPTDSQIAFRLRKLKTHFSRLDVDNDGFVSREDYELIAKKVIEFSNATGDKAEQCYKTYMDVADFLRFTLGPVVQKLISLTLG